MSQNPTTRRPLRSRAPTTTLTAKDSENANARPTRLTTRSKLGLGSTSSAAASKPPSKSATIDTKTTTTAAQPKRKREALGELATKKPQNGDKGKAAGGAGMAKGKDKSDTASLKGKADAASTTVRPTTRVPLRTLGGKPVSKASSAPVLKVEPPSQDDDAMAIDPATDQSEPQHTTGHSRNSSTSTTSSVKGRILTAIPVPVIKEEEEYEEDEAEAKRPHKKARPSSDALAPEDEEDIRRFLDDDDEAENDAPEVQISSRSREAQQRAVWDALDAEDVDDPVMVSEYVSDIFLYLQQSELKTMPNPNYMENQKELAWKMRGILIDWLIQMHSKFRLIPETLFLCVNIIDRFLSVRVCSLAKLQLVGATALLLAAKVEEVIAPGIDNIVWHSQEAFDAPDVIKAEKYLLKSIEWDLSYPNPMHFLRRVSKAESYEPRTRTLAKYLLEIGIIEWRLIGAPPSLLATAAIWLSRLMAGCGEWNTNLENYSSYPEDQLIPTANLMLNYILRPVKHESLYKKYAAKKFMKVSVLVREWALRRWAEGTSVPLARELPSLRLAIETEIRAAQQAADEEGGDENAA